VFKAWRKVYPVAAGTSIIAIFLFSFQNHTTQFWSPNLAPLLVVLLACCLWRSWKTNRASLFFLSGSVAALGVGSNMGFGIGVFVVSTLVTLLLAEKPVHKVSYLFGASLVFLPFLVFEARHGGNQISALLGTIQESPVALTGLSKLEIAESFLKIPGRTWGLPTVIGAVIGMVFLAASLRRKSALDSAEKKLAILLGANLLGLTIIYLLAKNPKWDYHFIGVETLFLLLVGLLAKWSRTVPLLVILACYTIINYFLAGRPQPTDFDQHLYLAEKEKILRLISQDAGNSEYSIVSNSAAIYTYDYDYLKWQRGIADYAEADVRYLIVPGDNKLMSEAFTEEKTPSQTFSTAKLWRRSDGTMVIKRSAR
jgi:hypothetical protein